MAKKYFMTYVGGVVFSSKSFGLPEANESVARWNLKGVERKCSIEDVLAADEEYQGWIDTDDTVREDMDKIKAERFEQWLKHTELEKSLNDAVPKIVDSD